MVGAGCLGRLADSMPFQPKPAAGKRRECQLARLPGLDLYGEPVGMQVQAPRCIAGDAPAQPVTLNNLYHALVGGQGTINDMQVPCRFCMKWLRRQRRHSGQQAAKAPRPAVVFQQRAVGLKPVSGHQPGVQLIWLPRSSRQSCGPDRSVPGCACRCWHDRRCRCSRAHPPRHCWSVWRAGSQHRCRAT